MPRLPTVLALLTFCSLAASCGEPDKVVEHLPTPPERLICELAGERPAVPREHEIDWTGVGTVAEAFAEHSKFVASVRSREGVVAGYIMRLEGKLFTCYTNMEWRRTFERDLSNP